MSNMVMKSIIDAINYWSKKTPNETAVQEGRARYSYAQLEQLSNNVAFNLKLKGISAGDVVAMCLPRVIDIWPVILGVFKAGAIYLPVDPLWPQARLESALKQAACRAIVVGEPVGGHSAEEWLAADLMKPQPEDAGVFTPSMHHVAYIIFTSGSTGLPKGVEISHSSLLHLLSVMKDYLSLDTSLRQLCITSFAFDLVIPDLFLPLLVGGCCVLDKGRALTSPQLLSQIIDDQQINLLQATPGTLQALNDSGWLGSQQLQLIIGGDKVPLALADALNPQVSALWHCYGPTEATVWSSMQLYEAGSGLAFQSSLPAYEFYLVDEAGEVLARPGAQGELLISGEGLALGYVGAPELTREKFRQIEMPDGIKRVYSTGDVFQYDESMSLSYRGRIDNQLKVSGHRVELGEIESVAELVDGLEQFVAEMVEGQLTGFYQAADRLLTGNLAIIEQALKAKLETTLPWYMLPTRFIAVAEFPLNHNKKVDRQALRNKKVKSVELPIELPDEKRDDSDISAYYLGQIKLAWRDAINTEIDELANCFDQGMDSLNVVSLLVALEKRMKINLPMTFVYSNPSLVKMAAALQSRYGLQSQASKQEESGPQLITLQQGEAAPLICIHPVGGGIYHYKRIAGYVGEGAAVYGLQAQGYDGGKPLYDIVTMAKRYALLIQSSFQTAKVSLLGGSMGGVLAIETAKQLQQINIQVETVYLLDAVGKVKGDVRVFNKAVTFRGLIRGLGLRLQDQWMQVKARLLFFANKRISNTWRYQYLILINHLALNKYLASKDYRKTYTGNVVLFRLPMQPQGEYADKFLGWDKVVKPLPQVYYVQGCHEKFLESEDFAIVFKLHYLLPL
jgi:amino acid adenylation domain-containing protein